MIKAACAQALAAVKAHDSEADAELPRQALQAEMAAFMVSQHLNASRVSPPRKLHSTAANTFVEQALLQECLTWRQPVA